MPWYYAQIISHNMLRRHSGSWIRNEFARSPKGELLVQKVVFGDNLQPPKATQIDQLAQQLDVGLRYYPICSLGCWDKAMFGVTKVLAKYLQRWAFGRKGRLLEAGALSSKNVTQNVFIPKLVVQMLDARGLKPIICKVFFQLARWLGTVWTLQCTVVQEAHESHYEWKRMQTSEQQAQRERKSIIQKALVFARRAKELLTEERVPVVWFLDALVTQTSFTGFGGFIYLVIITAY